MYINLHISAIHDESIEVLHIFHKQKGPLGTRKAKPLSTLAAASSLVGMATGFRGAEISLSLSPLLVDTLLIDIKIFMEIFDKGSFCPLSPSLQRIRDPRQYREFL